MIHGLFCKLSRPVCTDTTVNASTTPNDTTRDDATHDPSPPRRRHTPNVELNEEQRSSAPCAYLFNIPNLVTSTPLLGANPDNPRTLAFATLSRHTVQPDWFSEYILVQECDYRIHPWRRIVLAGYPYLFLLHPCSHPLASFHAAPVFRPYLFQDAFDSSPLPG